MGKLQIIRTPSGEEMVVLPRAEYDALLAAAEAADEDAADVAIYDARKQDLLAGQDGALPQDVSQLLLKGNSRVKAIRLWRDISQIELSKRAGVGQGYLSDIETGRRQGSAEVLRTLAEALDVPLSWIG